MKISKIKLSSEYIPIEVIDDIRNSLPEGYSVSDLDDAIVVSSNINIKEHENEIQFHEGICRWLWEKYKLQACEAFTYYGSICLIFRYYTAMKKRSKK